MKRGCWLDLATSQCSCPSRAAPTSPGTASPARTAAPASQTDPRTGITWVRIPGGTFQMGSDTGTKDEKPAHRVTVSTFELSRTEVTVAQYRKCMSAGKCTDPGWHNPKDPWRTFCNLGRKLYEDHPINCVDWNQAKAFAAWAGGRLPSEAEWEFAARSGDKGYTYPWGNDKPSCQKAVVEEGDSGCGKASTWVVCSKPAGSSVHGLCDMAGNVWEWVQDMWHGTYKRAPRDGRAWEDLKATGRVIRGGSWNQLPDKTRASYRAWFGPGYRDLDLGFRVARSAP